jgi:hypothetical protein
MLAIINLALPVQAMIIQCIFLIIVLILFLCVAQNIFGD